MAMRAVNCQRRRAWAGAVLRWRDSDGRWFGVDTKMTQLSGALQDLNDLYFFAAVVDHGGFSAAGRALGVPKSRLSKRVAQLEDRLKLPRVTNSTSPRLRPQPYVVFSRSAQMPCRDA